MARALLLGEGVLRHLQAAAEGARVAHFGVDVVRQRVRDPFRKRQHRQRTAAHAAELGREVLRLLDAVDLVAGGAAVFRGQRFAVLDLSGSRFRQVHVGQQVAVSLGLKEAGERGNLLRIEAVMRHLGVGIVERRVAQPGFQPLRLGFAADAGQLRPQVSADQRARGILHRVTGSAEGLSVEAGAGRGLGTGGCGLGSRLIVDRRQRGALRHEERRDIARVVVAELEVRHGCRRRRKPADS